MYKNILGIVISVLLISVNCVAGEQFKVEPRALGKNIKSFNSEKMNRKNLIQDEKYDLPNEALTLSQALSLALIRNPQLRAFSWEISARESRALQAGLPTNPEISFELEDFGGSGSVEGFRGTETTILLSQLVTLGGKLSKRKRVALLNRELAEWDYEQVRLNVLTITTQAFINVIAAQRKLKLTNELVALAGEVYKAVAEQASAGQISPIQEKRALVDLSQAEIRLKRAKRNLESARRELVSLWGGNTPKFERASGDLESVLPVPPFDKFNFFISQNPEIARWTTEMEQREAVLKLEKANVIPDPFISGGYRRINENDDNAFVIGFSIPIPILNRNQGAIGEARYRIIKAKEEKKNAEAMVNISLANSYKNLKSSFNDVTALKNTVLPAAESAYQSIFEGYREGKFSLLDVLDSQRTLFDTQFQYIEALQNYHLSLANVERLTGMPVEEIQNYQNAFIITDENKTTDQREYKVRGELK